MGILLIKDVLLTFPQLFSSIYYFFRDSLRFEDIVFLLLPIGLILIYIVVVYYLIFSTDRIIKILSLEKDFEDKELKFNIHRSSVLSIVFLVVGVYIFVDSIPVFIGSIISYLRQNEMANGLMNYNVSFDSALVSASKMILAYILITNQKSIVNWIEIKRKNKKNID